MNRRSLKNGLIGAAVGVAALVIVGALYGAFGGIQLEMEDGRPYQHLSGIDGAFVGVLIFLAFGAVPIAILGAVGGIALGKSRERS